MIMTVTPLNTMLVLRFACRNSTWGRKVASSAVVQQCSKLWMLSERSNIHATKFCEFGQILVGVQKTMVTS